MLCSPSHAPEGLISERMRARVRGAQQHFLLYEAELLQGRIRSGFALVTGDDDAQQETARRLFVRQSFSPGAVGKAMEEGRAPQELVVSARALAASVWTPISRIYRGACGHTLLDIVPTVYCSSLGGGEAEGDGAVWSVLPLGANVDTAQTPLRVRSFRCPRTLSLAAFLVAYCDQELRAPDGPIWYAERYDRGGDALCVGVACPAAEARREGSRSLFAFARGVRLEASSLDTGWLLRPPTIL